MDPKARQPLSQASADAPDLGDRDRREQAIDLAGV